MLQKPGFGPGKKNEYLMESEDEAIRLEVKTDPDALRRQALWCGVKPGMRVLDVGCGPGKTTALLYEMVQPGGSVTGIDFSRERIQYARENYGGRDGIEFQLRDFCLPLSDIGNYDFIWVRFVLEYFRAESSDIVKNLKSCLKPGGTLCLLDLDYNCLSHYEMPPQMAEILPKIMAATDEKLNFDTFAGRKLYSYIYDNGFLDIAMNLEAHHLIYGKAAESDIYNWMKKIEVAAKKVESIFQDYENGYEGFISDFQKFFLDNRRFTYTPLIICKGVTPLAD